MSSEYYHIVGIKKNVKLLRKTFNVTKKKFLTKENRKIYDKLTSWSKRISYMQKQIKNKTRIAKAEKFVQSPYYTQLLNYVNNPTYNFIMCQVRNQLLSPPRRRYTLEEKILALCIFKVSPKAYRFLSKMFALPSSKTLTNLLKKIPFQPGINEQIFKSLKESVQKMASENEKMCVLMFDEMYIDSGIHYSQSEDAIVGLECYGNEKIKALADYANVFFLKVSNNYILFMSLDTSNEGLLKKPISQGKTCYNLTESILGFFL